ncbi:hypothetical protein AsFcp4_225 [Aeromonas phage AsFcp_4]|nr:hypothetical protein AsFcp4_225 [Aeromonas phage AsFcp_4]
MLIADIKKMIMKRRVDELAKRLKKENIAFERYRDCCVVSLECMKLWVTPGLMRYKITNDCTPEVVEINHIKGAIAFVKTLIKLDKDL